MLYALIMAGGKGTRLYPLSRKKNPKQFLKVINNQSFLRNTIERIKKLVDKDNIYVVTNKDYYNNLCNELPEINKENIFVEPSNRETATCIGLSAIKLLKKDQDATMIVLPSDHYIKENDQFIDTINQGVEIVQKKRGLITIGIKPTRPETGYGYIKSGQRIASRIPSYKVERFLEKPNFEIAKDLIMDERYLWNSGIFLWRADVFLREMSKYLPNIYEKLMVIYKYLGTENEEKIINEQYNLIDGISVDFGIMQKTRKAYVIKSNFAWDDIGSFDSLGRFLNKENGNNIKGNVYLEQSLNCSVFGDKKLIIGFGVKDLVIVDSGDVILIMDKNKDQELKQLVGKMKDDKDLNKYL